MDAVIRAIETNDVTRLKDLLLTNREVVIKHGLSYLAEFVKDAEMFRTLYMTWDKDIVNNRKKKRGSFLLEAIRERKDLKVIEGLINLDKDCINRPGRKGRTALIEAVREDSDVSLMKFLLENNGDLNLSDFNGYYPLHFANDAEIVKLLIENGAQVKCKNGHGSTPLINAIRFDDDRMTIIELINLGADIEARDQNGKTCLHHALNLKYDEEIINLICSKIDNYNMKDRFGYTPLCYTYQKNLRTRRNDYEPNFIHKLISKGFDMNARVLMHAVSYCDDIELLTSFLQYIDVRCINENGNCVLHHAGNARVIRMLARRGAPVNHRNCRGDTPLMEALYWFDKEVIESLLIWGADMKDVDCSLEPLSGNRDYKDASVYDLLVLYGFDVSLEDEIIPFFLNTKLNRMTQDRTSYEINYPDERTFIGHIFLSNDNAADHPMLSYRLMSDPGVCKLIEIFESELHKMKYEFIKENITYYDFCMKQYKRVRSRLVDEGFTSSDFENIKQLFPTFYVKIKTNIKIYNRRALLKKLMNVRLAKRSERQNNSNEDQDSGCNSVVLDCDSLYILGSFMKDIEIKCLLAAAII